MDNAKSPSCSSSLCDAKFHPWTCTGAAVSIILKLKIYLLFPAISQTYQGSLLITHATLEHALHIFPISRLSMVKYYNSFFLFVPFLYEASDMEEFGQLG